MHPSSTPRSLSPSQTLEIKRLISTHFLQDSRMNSEEERKIAKRVKGLTIHDQSRRNKPPKIPPAATSKKRVGLLTVDEFVVNVLFAEKDPDDMTYDEIGEALAYYLPNSCFARKRKRVENVDVVGPSGGEVPKADGVEVVMDCDWEGPKETEEGGKVTRKPCSHLYHGDCIMTWLGIRNTCPVCWHKLPTNDAEYEKRKDGRVCSGSASSLFDDFGVRYNFQLLP